MPTIEELIDHYKFRAQEVRMIAEGIWDFKERKTVMDLADDFERLAREVRTKHEDVILPFDAAKRRST